MLIKDIMTVYPIHIHPDANLRRATEIISIAEVSDIMVVDDDGIFVGVLSEGDILRTLLPNYDEIIAAGGTLHDAFEFFIHKGGELANYPIAPLVIREPITVSPTDEAAQIATILVEKQIRRLPVVDHNRLVGTVSRADICRAVIYNSR
jgi:CBS domain-containing protein